jgi:HPt (histidine-containing phosphotransfer) domain-containing protein
MQPNPASPVSFNLHHSAELGGEPVIDQDAFSILESLADEDDPDLVNEIVGLFLEDSATRMSQIQDGLQEGGADSVRAAAHALKSASANVGALSFSTMCAGLESAAQGGSEAELADLVTSALKMYADVRSALMGEPVID